MKPPPDFELLFQAIPGAYLVLGPDLTVVAASDALLASTNTHREHLVGRPVFEVLPDDPENPSGFAVWRASLLRVLETRAPDVMPTVKYSVQRPAQEGGGFTDKYWRPANFPVLGPDGAVRYIIHRTEEVSELQRTLEERELAQVKAREAEARIKMQLQLVQRGVNVAEGTAPPPEKLARTLELSNRQLTRLTALIEDLLDVSRIQSGRMSYNFEEAVDVGALVNEVAERLAQQLHAAGCPVELALAANVTVTCDRFRIEQVVTNLLSNAIKYGAGTHVRITVAPSASGATLSVSDGGMGIAEGRQDEIFNRFERAVSHNISGLGLGLYITRQIIDAHGGTVGVKSKPGEGATFTVELPRDPPRTPGS